MTNPDYTHLAFVVDRSGSMATIRNDMEGAIKTVLADQAAQPGELHVDIWTFDTTVEHPYQDARADDVKGELIDPRGSTALNDALGGAIQSLGERFAALHEDDRPGTVVVAVVTDGEENASREYSKDAVKAAVERQQSEFGWTFIFLGAESIDAFSAASGYGIAHGQTMSYSASSAGVQGMGVAASSLITRSRAGEDAEFSEDERTAAKSS